MTETSPGYPPDPWEHYDPRYRGFCTEPVPCPDFSAPLDPDFLDYWANYGSPHIRGLVAQHPNTDAETHRLLAMDEDETVREKNSQATQALPGSFWR